MFIFCLCNSPICTVLIFLLTLLLFSCTHVFVMLFLLSSTAEFRNAFLKTIRQIIRESVRNMSIPATKPGTGPGILLVTAHRQNHANSQTLERPDRTKTMIPTGPHTLGKIKKTGKNQRHSAGNIDYDNISQEADEPPTGSFRTRCKTVGDTVGKCVKRLHKRFYSFIYFFC